MSIARVAILGLGTMGPGMAAVLARAGLAVGAYDISDAQRAAAPAGIAAAARALDQIGMSPATADVTIFDDMAEALHDADLVIENVPEQISLKREVIAQAAELVRDDCIIASDTSGIPITDLQRGMPTPGRVVGMHWSNPPHIIPMIEVIAGEETEPVVRDAIVALVRRLGLVPVQVGKDVPGFVENRILYAVMREAVDLVERGVVSPEDLDTCVRWGIGYKLSVIGPMALLDMAGLDIYKSVSGYLNASLCARSDVAEMISSRVAAGKLGLKTASGIFDYAAEELPALRAERIDRLVAVRRALQD